MHCKQRYDVLSEQLVFQELLSKYSDGKMINTPFFRFTCLPCVIIITATSFMKVENAESSLTCNFDYSWCDFQQDYTDQFDWSRRSGNTPSAGTGPSVDHTSGHGKYVYIESSSPRRSGDKARLIWKPLQSLNTVHCLTFFYHMHGEHIGDLSVIVIIGISTMHRLWLTQGSSGDQWAKASIHLPSTTRQVTFEATTGISYRGDIAIDDVTVSKGSCMRKFTARVFRKTDVRKVCSTEEYGRQGIVKFSDKLVYKNNGNPARILIRHNNKGIRKIMFGYGEHFSSSSSGSSDDGIKYTLNKLGASEVITSVDLEYDYVIRRIIFRTNRRRQIGPFGCHGLFRKHISGTSLLYISGSEDSNHVTSLQFHFSSKCDENVLENSVLQSLQTPTYDLNPNLMSNDTHARIGMDRLSSQRTLNVEIAVFLDTAYAHHFYHYSSLKSGSNLRAHVVQLLRKVQRWYVHPSLGYRLLFTLVKVFHLTPEQESFRNFFEFCQFQSTFQKGGENLNGSFVGWDISLLLTGKRGMFGRRSNGRAIEGRANLGGCCNPTEMCAGAYHHFDKEYYMVRLLAHEMAHTFGIKDDYHPPNNRKCRRGLMYNQHRGNSFSKCSVEDLERWLLSERSMCLDTLPKSTNETTKLFDSSMFIKPIGAVDGSWGLWSTWSTCSRTCGGGVRRQRRECNSPSPIRGGRACTGHRYRNMMCRTESCVNPNKRTADHSSILLQYADECARKYLKRYTFPEIEGIYREGTARCQTMCTPVGKNYYRYYSVVDGFSCSSIQNDVCVDGVCLERGCDDETFESKARYDVCGVCGGNGTSCKVYNGTYYGEFIGRRRMLRIPQHAFNIKVNIRSRKHKDMAGNVIHLRTISGWYLTDIRSYSDTRVIAYAGSSWEYIYDKFGGWLPHLLRTKGPITKDVDIYLHRTWHAKPNLGIEYTYTLLNVHRRHRIAS